MSRKYYQLLKLGQHMTQKRFLHIGILGAPFNKGQVSIALLIIFKIV